MTIFNAIAAREHANDTKLGMPSIDRAHFDRRMHLMSTLRGGNGWSKLPAEPKKNAQGLTRGDRKRAARERANAKVSEHRDYEFLNSPARRLIDEQKMQVAA